METSWKTPMRFLEQHNLLSSETSARTYTEPLERVTFLKDRSPANNSPPLNGMNASLGQSSKKRAGLKE
jgi:hypothetical protein